ncbi:unnamed protein product [Prorocentrum cordatum]|uniref:ER lumen protein-retaining receptor n=1 Tax=Prorocentrum cordatum TaxID=2364126 RepID=A0ABN9PQC2_9DINO|nr:unnamed protein product [Polarella glacialis]
MRYKVPISQTYERSTDSFQYELYVLGPCFVIGLLCTEEYTIPDILWSTSIWLESVENLTADFVGTLGAYRFFYILNWIYRYFAEDLAGVEVGVLLPPQDYVNVVGWIGGLVQTGLYCDFFYYYAKSKWYGSKLVLPVSGDAA